MTMNLTRRRLLGATIAAPAVLSLTGMPAQAAAPRRLVALRATLEVKGKPASVFGLRNAEGGHGLTLAPGERFAVDLLNQAGEDTIVHWHGQTPPNAQDGVVESGGALLANGTTQSYDFAPRPGTHWMHSHHGLQEQRLMAAPLVVHTADDARADMQEVVVLLHDFTFRDPGDVLAQLTRGGGGMQHGGMMGMGGGTHLDLNDVEYDAYLANDRTLDDPLLVRTERGGRVRLRLINGATSTAFWIGVPRATVLAVDGNQVRPLMAAGFPLAPGQRIDLLVAMPAQGSVPVLAQREGDVARTGIILATPDAPVSRITEHAPHRAPAVDLSLEQRLVAAAPLAARAADVTHRIVLSGGMMDYAWTIDGRSWRDRRPLKVRQGQRVVLEMLNHSMMAHPMHLHGHHFQVMALNGQPISGALRDTVLVPPMRGSVTVAFDADNQGNWLLHCHNLLHMASGMMTELVYV